jgi:hypothetical protein
MEVAQLRHHTRELEHVHCPGDVNLERGLARNGEIVKRSEMKDPRRLLENASRVSARQTQLRMCYVALDYLKIVNSPSGELSNARDLVSCSGDK